MCWSGRSVLVETCADNGGRGTDTETNTTNRSWRFISCMNCLAHTTPSECTVERIKSGSGTARQCMNDSFPTRCARINWICALLEARRNWRAFVCIETMACSNRLGSNFSEWTNSCWQPIHSYCSARLRKQIKTQNSSHSKKTKVDNWKWITF